MSIRTQAHPRTDEPGRLRRKRRPSLEIEVDFSRITESPTETKTLHIPAAVNDMTPLDAALTYAKAGIYVGPLAPGTKNPGSLLKKGWDTKTSRDPAKIRSWFEKWPNAGVFIHAGRSNLAIFDFDGDSLDDVAPEIARPLRNCVFQSSRGEGDRGHYVARTDEALSNSPGGFAPYGDFRGKNGVIVASPTVHPETGVRYRWVRGGEIPELDPKLRALVHSAGTSAKEPLAPAHLMAFCREHTTSRYPSKLGGPLNSFVTKVGEGESRHGAMMAALGWAIREIRAGAYPANQAFEALRGEWDKAFSPGHSRTPHAQEFDNMVRWAAAQPDAREAADEIWAMSPVMGRIKRFANDHGVGPFGMLGIGIIRALLAVPAYVCLPDTVGTRAPPNLFLAIVAKSGGGKGMTEKLGRRLFPFPPAVEEDVFQGTPGSGEGVAKMFGSLQPVDGEKKFAVVYDHSRVNLSAPEVDSLGALFGRDSSTLSETLRKAAVGEGLGYGYANKSKNIPVGDDRYRICMQVGVQPLRADALFSEAGGGLPQRFVWSTVNDPDAVDVDPASRGSEIIPLPEWPHERHRSQVWKSKMGEAATYEELVQVSIPKSVEAVIRSENLRRRREDPFETGDGDKYDGHRLLVVEKVALGLAVLHGKTHGFDEIHWEMAQRFMAHSDWVRESTEQVMRGEAQKKQLARAKAEGKAAVVREDAAHKTMRREVREVVLDLLKQGPKTGAAFSKKFGEAKRKMLPEVLDDLRRVDKLITRQRVASGNTEGWRYSLR